MLGGNCCACPLGCLLDSALEKKVPIHMGAKYRDIIDELFYNKLSELCES